MALFPRTEAPAEDARDQPRLATAAYATPFEVPSAIAQRAHMVYMGNPVRLPQHQLDALALGTPCGVPCPVDVATLEMAQGALTQFALERALPSGRVEVAPLSRLRLPDNHFFAWAPLL